MKMLFAATLAVLTAAWPALAADPTQSAAEFEKAVFPSATGDGPKLPYRLLKPAGYDPKGTAVYPLVILLHGSGERGDDNEAQLKHVAPEFAKPANRKQYPCFLLVPQCPKDKKWVEVDWSADRNAQPTEPSEPMGLLMKLIAQLKDEQKVDAKRIYVAGLSMGGYGTWDLAARKPEWFAAAVPICGGADESTAPKLARMPLWAFHGLDDNAVKPERSQRMIAAIRKAGGKPGFTEYPGVGHDSWNPAFRDPQLWTWLFAQKRS